MLNCTDADKEDILKNLWVPDKHFDFPGTKFGDRMRKFNHSWLETFTWLVYSKSEDGAYCKYCFLFSPKQVGNVSSQNVGQLVIHPYRNWKKAVEHFQHHQNLQYHRTAVIKADNFLTVSSGKTASIENQVDTARARQVQANQERLIPIIKTIILCGRQGLPLRGHRDTGMFDIEKEPEDNEGNFRALLRARIDSGDMHLKKHFQICSANATYTSWKIQNEIIEACDIIIKKKICDEVNAVKCFSILFDETTDMSCTEQCSFCVRYLKNIDGKYVICEHFLQFIPTESTTGASLANVIINTINSLNINILYLRGQGYDGAASMSGQLKGVHAIINQKYPTALYVHCAAHSLNLAISDASEVQGIRNCTGIIGKVYSFFNTPKRQFVLQKNVHATLPESRKEKLKQMCPTRWIQRHDSVMVMNELLEPVVLSLQEISLWADKDTSSNASMLLSALKQPEFLVSLLCMQKLLAFSLPLCKILQLENADLASALNNAEDLISSIRDIRNNADREFSEIFEQAKLKADMLGTEIKIPRITSRQAHRPNPNIESCVEYYKISIFLPWIDYFLSSVERRFTKHKAVIAKFMVLLPNGEVATKKQREEFISLAGFYENDINEPNDAILEAELRLWYQKFISYEGQVPKNPYDAINMCSADIFPSVFVLLKIFATLPVSTSTAERSFSTLRRLKTYLRNSVGERRLNGLANLNIHREVNVDPKEVLSLLKQMGPRRIDFVL